MAEQTCTHADISRELGVSVTTIKSYRRKFPAFMPVPLRGKPLRFPARMLDICRAIRDLFSQGLSVEEVSKELSSKFPSNSKSDNLSESEVLPQASQAASQLDDLLEQVRSLARDAAGAQGLGRRVEALEQGLDRVREGQEKILAGQEQLARQLGEMSQRLAAARPEARRVVTVRGASGRRDSYELGAEQEAAREPDPGASAGVKPPEAFLSLPVVVRSERGEFLGVTDKAGHPFTLAQFEDYLLNRAGLAPGAGTWQGQGDAWNLSFGRSGPEAHGLGFAKTRTQRGNLVALFRLLEVGGKEMSDTFRTAFFRQIKESFDR